MSKIIASAEAENTGAFYSTAINVHQHSLTADELPEYGGLDLGPSPMDYLCIALASCKAITLRMYCERKQWPVTSVNVKVTLVKAEDMATAVNTFFCDLSIKGELSAEQKKRLVEISKACPVQKLLGKPAEIVTIMMES